MHEIAGRKSYSLAEAQTIRADEMNVNIAWPAVFDKLEVVVLDVLQVVTHFFFTSANPL
jgi:hypothetical protein